MNNTKDKKILLYSGGTDSWLIDKIWYPDVKLYVDMNGTYSKDEIERLPNDVKIIDFKLGQFEQENKFIPLRNLFLLMLASNYGNNICIGAIKGDDGCKDKTMKFLEDAENLMNYCLTSNTTYDTSSPITVERRFKNMTKYELLDTFIRNGGDIDEFVNSTFSCYNPINGKECWNCKPCYRKFLLCKYFGYMFDKESEDKMLEYMKTKVIPMDKKEKGSYFTERVGEGAYAEKAMDRFFKQYDLDWRSFQ